MKSHSILTAGLVVISTPSTEGVDHRHESDRISARKGSTNIFGPLQQQQQQNQLGGGNNIFAAKPQHDDDDGQDVHTTQVIPATLLEARVSAISPSYFWLFDNYICPIIELMSCFVLVHILFSLLATQVPSDWRNTSRSYYHQHMHQRLLRHLQQVWSLRNSNSNSEV